MPFVVHIFIRFIFYGSEKIIYRIRIRLNEKDLMYFGSERSDYYFKITTLKHLIFQKCLIMLFAY